MTNRRDALKYIAAGSLVGGAVYSQLSKADSCVSITSTTRYVVKQIDDYVHVIEAETGSSVYSHSDPYTAIQWSLDALTPGRTSNELIVIKGDFLVNYEIKIESYTSIRIQGVLKADIPLLGFSKAIFSNKDAGGNSYLEISGGVINCNSAEPSSSMSLNGIHFVNSSDINIHDVTILNPNNEGINFNKCTRFIIDAVKIDGAGDDCLSILEESNTGVICNSLLTGCKNITGGSGTIEIEDGSYQIVVTNNASYSNIGNGLSIITDSISTFPACHSIVVSNNIFKNNTKSGVSAQSQVDKLSNNILITNNIIVGNGDMGIYFGRVEYSSISNNFVEGNNSHGVSLLSSENVLISNNQCLDNGVNGINLYASTYNNIFNNNSMNNSVDSSYGAGIRLTRNSDSNYVSNNNLGGKSESSSQQFGVLMNYSGDNTIMNNRLIGLARSEVIRETNQTTENYYCNNTGWMTENSGKSVIQHDDQSVLIYHGLDVSPVMDDIVVTANSDLGEASNIYVETVEDGYFTVSLNTIPNKDVLLSWQIRHFRH